MSCASGLCTPRNANAAPAFPIDGHVCDPSVLLGLAPCCCGRTPDAPPPVWVMPPVYVPPPRGEPAQVRQPGRPVAVEDPRGTAVKPPQGTPAPVKFPGVLITTPVLLPSEILQTGQTAADVTPSPSQDLVSKSYCDRPENRDSELCMDPTVRGQEVPGPLVQAKGGTKSAGMVRAYNPAGDTEPCGRPASMTEREWTNLRLPERQRIITECEANRRRTTEAEDARARAEREAAEREARWRAAITAFNTTASTVTELVRSNQDYLLARRRLENEAQARELAASLDRQRLETETALRQLQASPASGDANVAAMMVQLQAQLSELRSAAQAPLTQQNTGMSYGAKVAVVGGVAALAAGAAYLLLGRKRSSEPRQNPRPRARRRARR